MLRKQEFISLKHDYHIFQSNSQDVFMFDFACVTLDK